MKYIVDIKGEIEGDYEIIGKYEESELIKAYTKGFDTGVETVKNERPQGEWKITDSYPHKVYCDKCFKTYAQANWDVWKDGTLARDFCPNCGADMRKGGAE